MELAFNVQFLTAFLAQLPVVLAASSLIYLQMQPAVAALVDITIHTELVISAAVLA